jgi:hypothetical protein
MDRQLFSDPTAPTTSTTFVPVRVTEEDKSDAASTLRTRHNVLGLPTLVVVPHEGKEPRRIQVFPGRPETIGFLRAAVHVGLP